MKDGFNFEDIEYLRDYFLPKIESGTKLPNIRDAIDGTEFILVEGAQRTPYKMLIGKWHKMVVDVNSIVRYEEA